MQARENELEDHYENYKYTQKKNQNKKEGEKKIGFDYSTAVSSKRKSKLIWFILSFYIINIIAANLKSILKELTIS